MGRFLTPSKVALLVLAQVYLKELIASTATADVLQVLLAAVLFDTDSLGRRQSLNPFDTISDVEQSLSGCASVIPGRTVWDLFLKHLWEIDCADALEYFITELSRYLVKSREDLLKDRDEGLAAEAKGKVIRTSPIGVFIRRCSIEYLKPQFQESIALWLEFIKYRMPTRSAFARKDPHLVRNSFDSVLSEFKLDHSHELTGLVLRPLVVESKFQDTSFSVFDSEKLMEFQVSEMQSLGGRLPELMKVRLKNMAVLGTATPKLAYYLRFLDSWRAGDFASAFDNLHRYFDYTMQSRERTFYQYALLNLAILQADFGCHDEAISAMQEAIATARENRDTICLNYCMSWLYHFGRAFPAQMQAARDTGILGDEAEGLSFIKSRAKEAEMWTLLSTSLLSEAKIALQNGENLAACFENIVKAAHINVVKAVPNSTGPTLLMKTTLFARMGQAHMARACGQRFLLCHSQEAPLEDVLKCTGRQANLLAQSGRNKCAQVMLDSLPVHVLAVLKYKIHHTTTSRIVRARYLLQRGHMDAAGFMVENLVAQLPYPEVDISIQVTLLQIDMFIRRKDFIQALTQLTLLAERTALENKDVHLVARFLALKATLLARGDSPLSGFSLVMRALDMSYRAKALPALWESAVALAVILIAAYEFAAARALLESILPHILECQDCDLAGRTYLCSADVYIGLAGFAGPNGNNGNRTGIQQNLLISKALTALEKAGEQFRWVEDLDQQLEALAKTSRIYAWKGDVELAAHTADKYVELKRDCAGM